jgi:hypothetical protein
MCSAVGGASCSHSNNTASRSMSESADSSDSQTFDDAGATAATTTDTSTPVTESATAPSKLRENLPPAPLDANANAAAWGSAPAPNSLSKLPPAEVSVPLAATPAGCENANLAGAEVAVALAGEFAVLDSSGCLPAEVVSGISGPAGLVATPLAAGGIAVAKDPVGAANGLVKSAWNNTAGGLTSLAVQANGWASQQIVKAGGWVTGLPTEGLVAQMGAQSDSWSQAVLAHPNSPAERVGMVVGDAVSLASGVVGLVKAAPAMVGRVWGAQRGADEAVESMKTKLDEFAAAGAKTVSSKVGKNDVTWKLDADGYPVRAEGDLREVFPNAPRSAAEIKAQGKAADRGEPGDVGGHIFGHRFVLNQGDKNLFPQNGQFNSSAYKKLENEWADVIKTGKKEVHVEIEFSGGTAARPDKMEVFYKVVDPATGKTVSKKTVDFDNEAGQVFDRTPKKDMQ